MSTEVFYIAVVRLGGSCEDLVLSIEQSARLRRLQELVGGCVEGIPLSDDRYMVLNAHGKDGPHCINQQATEIAHISGSIMMDDYIAGVAVALSPEVSP